MIIEHYSEKPVYIISALRINDMYGEPLPPNKRYYTYLNSRSACWFSSLIDDAIEFISPEKAKKYLDDHKIGIMEEVNDFCDVSTLKIRKRTVRIIEEDVLSV